MYTEQSVFLNPNENWFEVHQWNPDTEQTTIDRHYLTGRTIRSEETRGILYRLGFKITGDWSKSWARPGQWFALLTPLERTR